MPCLFSYLSLSFLSLSLLLFCFVLVFVFVFVFVFFLMNKYYSSKVILGQYEPLEPKLALIPSRKERKRERRRNSYSVVIFPYDYIGLNR